MKTKYDAYNSWVSFFIVTCETLITGGLFYLLFLTTEDTPWHKILQAPHLQVILTVMLCYFVSAMQAGVVLYIIRKSKCSRVSKRKVHFTKRSV